MKERNQKFRTLESNAMLPTHLNVAILSTEQKEWSNSNSDIDNIVEMLVKKIVLILWSALGIHRIKRLAWESLQ